MKAAIRDQRRDRTGRFGRDLHAAPAEGRPAEARPAAHADGREERFEIVGYVIDADAVAAAILSRLLAGGTLPDRS